MIDYHIIATGSDGNAVLINDEILIDCGVPFKALMPYYKDLKLVLLTHKHSDHFNRTTIRRLADTRPTLRFACANFMAEQIFQCGVDVRNIDIIQHRDFFYQYAENLFVAFFPLYHDVPNVGWKLIIGNEKMIYATDTSSMENVKAENYDLYLIEANYDKEEIEQRITEKQLNDEFAYEIRAMRNHLSKQQAIDWLYSNMGINSKYCFLHQHHDREVKLSESSSTDGQADERSRAQEDNNGQGRSAFLDSDK